VWSSGVHADRREPAGSREVGGREQQARLADARLALERDPDEPGGSRPELLLDRGHLGRAADEHARRTERVEGERRGHGVGGRERARARSIPFGDRHAASWFEWTEEA
jgi:hypothetical protein